ncbi:mitochondrial antiviral-signaling protein [Oxyura jamaicensis]|uniref:mitochondrial antiviral-signaling protein n=1 Tax=Oxyura jamaicensis TaxID=8884 RepID=UPI0015A60FA2|nr:mitochondrial antiviral-signaling protein [Oxyura jamaicensis]
MGFAEDKVYGHILRNMDKFKNIHVASLVDSLSCLTEADRDELHTREEVRGSNATAYKFYQHVKCRRGWVTDLINALHQNNAGHLAEELQQVYDLYQTSPPRAAAPPAAPNPVAASFPPDARPAASVSAQLPFPGPKPAVDAPLADPPRCTSLTGGHPPPQRAAATAASPAGSSAASTDVPSTDLDARAPVQEKPLEKKSPQPPLQPVSTTYDGASDGHGAEGSLPCPAEAQRVAAGLPGAAGVVLPSAAPPEQGREWLSQRYPVCVDNGCFGNAKHLHRAAPGSGLGTAVPLRDPVTARGAGQPRNEPQEDVYISAELPTGLAEPPCRGGAQEKQAALGPEHGGPPSSFVDVRSPLLIQQQFDAEQKRVGMLRGHEGGDARMETTAPIAAPRDTSPSHDVSWKLPVPEKMLPAGKAASSTHSVPAEEKVLQASMAPLRGPAVGGSSVGTTGRTSSRGSSATSIWASANGPEEDVELSKPGVLLSLAGDSPQEAAGHKSGAASEATDHLGLSSDPLLVSADSSGPGEAPNGSASGRCSSAPAAPGGEEAGGARSCSPLSWRTDEIRVAHSPSALLEASNDVHEGAGPLGSPPASDSSGVPSPGDGPGLSLPYLVPAVGIALISAVAFLVYARLQK